MQSLGAERRMDLNENGTYITTDTYYLLFDDANSEFISYLELSNPSKPTPLMSYEVESLDVKRALLPLDSLSSPDNLDVYVTHLESLGYIKVEMNPVDEPVSIINTQVATLGGITVPYTNVKQNEQLKDEVVQYAILKPIVLTSLGRLFVDACCPDN